MLTQDLATKPDVRKHRALLSPYSMQAWRRVRLRSSTGGPDDSYNVGGGNERTNLTVVQAICDRLDQLNPTDRPRRELITFVADRPGHDQRYATDATKLKTDAAVVRTRPRRPGSLGPSSGTSPQGLAVTASGAISRDTAARTIGSLISLPPSGVGQIVPASPR